MASAGGDNDENHWPGYVDALTTMTMMLIFVMMILSVAMFSMSESVSRGLIEKIAAAAGVAVNSEGLSTGDYAEQVVNKLGDRSPGQADGRGLLSDGGGQGVGGAAAPAIKPTTGYAGAPGEERRIESGVEAPPVPPTPGVRIDRAWMHLTLVYKPRSTGLDTDSEAAIKTFVEDIARASPEAIFSIHA